MSSLNLTDRETLSFNSGVNNPNINIILVALRETKLKIKDLKLFSSDRIKYKAFIY
jgi:hypothetical protein